MLPLHRSIVPLLVLAACASSSTAPAPAASSTGLGDGGADGAATPLAVTAADAGGPALSDAEEFRRSFAIVDARTLAALDDELAMGKLLYGASTYVSSQIPAWNAAHPDDTKKSRSNADFATQPFRGGSDDVTKNAAAAPETRYGVPIVDSFAERIVPAFRPETDPRGPFRLLAIFNRVDLTGDMDLRSGGQLAGGQRRWLGEARLVFGLREPLDAKTPFPMTFIMEYRLPALTTDAAGNDIEDPTFDFATGPSSMADWIERRKAWPAIWARLAELEPGSPAYVTALTRIVRLFATGKNHVTLRTGEQVRDAKTGALRDEFEYHEFYLNGNWMLARRKLRREPFACSQSSIVPSRIDGEWDEATQDMAWNYVTGPRQLTDPEIALATAGCGGHLPYAQGDDGEGIELRTKFARFTPQTVWRPAGTSEARRHAFALGACSGCHAAETGAGGFQVRPSLVGQDATLSSFLAGATSATPNGTRYDYDEPARRLDLSRRFARGEDVPGDTLHHLECFDATTCKVQ